MKKLINLLTFFLLSFLLMPTLSAKEFGEHPERAKYRLTVTEGKKLNVRDKASTRGTLIYQLRPGDVLYYNGIEPVEADGYKWIRVVDDWGTRFPKAGYVTNLQRFTLEENPLYAPPSEEVQKIEDAAESSRNVTKWILLALCIIGSGIFLWLYFYDSDYSEWRVSRIIGEKENGMRRTFFFNYQPYMAIVMFTLMLLAGIAAAVLLMITVGGVGFAFLWLVKILCYIIKWAGILMCIGGILAIFGKEVGAGIICAVVGGVIWYFSKAITDFGDACAETGLAFFNEFNILGYTADLFVQYWKPALTIVCIPLVLFFGLAALWLIIAGALILTEKIMTNRYNIKHPCPHCQKPSEPADYLSKGGDGYMPIPNDIRLRPGVYGLFHITHPYTGERMPTMILNGRDRLARVCASCGKRIQADEGTELHLTFVGSPQSGKSTLSYRMIAEIFNRAGEDKVSYTDTQNTIKDRSMISKIENIRAAGEIGEGDLPSKTALDDLASTQLIIKRNLMPVPYRLFINDVGGELFDPTNASQEHSATRFFGNANSIMLMLDPVTTDFSEGEPSKNYRKWLNENVDSNVGKLKIGDIMDTMDNQISIHGNNPRLIHLNIVLPKIDMGYLPEDIDLTSQDQLRAFVSDEMGLFNLIHWAGRFASFTIYAVSATSQTDESNIAPLIDGVIGNQLGITL